MVEDFGSLDATAVLAIITWCYTCRLQVPADSANSCQDLLAYLQLQGLANHLMEERSALAGLFLATALSQKAESYFSSALEMEFW